MIKVLHVYKSYYPETQGGVESFIHTLCTGGRSHDVQAEVLTTTTQSTFYHQEIHGVNVTYCPQTLNIASCPLSWKMWRVFKRWVQRFDVVHAHFPWPFIDLLSLRTKVPIVLTYHSDIVKQRFLSQLIYPLQTYFLQRKVQVICATSQNYVDSSKVLKQFVDKTQVVPLGLPPCHIEHLSVERTAYWRQQVGTGFLLTVGVLRYYKGLDFLIDAAIKIGAPLVIVGDGPLWEKIADKVKGIDHIYLLGSVTEEDKHILLMLSRMVISSAHQRSEAFCLSLVEGLMHGKPLISTQLKTGTSFVNQHLKTGLVIAPASVNEMVQAIQKLQQDDDFYQQCAHQARSRYLDCFQADHMVEQYCEIYRRLLLR